MIFAVKKLANKITEGLRTAIFTSHERSRRQATNTISAWNSYQIRGGRVSCHPRFGRAEVVTHKSFYLNRYATCDFKISSPVTVSLL